MTWPKDTEPVPDYASLIEMIVLERVKARIAVLFPDDATFDNLSVTKADYAADKIVFGVIEFLAKETFSSTEEKENSFAYCVYSSWWDHLKATLRDHSRFGRFFKRLRVKETMKLHKFDYMTINKTYNACPHIHSREEYPHYAFLGGRSSAYDREPFPPRDRSNG